MAQRILISPVVSGVCVCVCGYVKKQTPGFKNENSMTICLLAPLFFSPFPFLVLLLSLPSVQPEPLILISSNFSLASAYFFIPPPPRSALLSYFFSFPKYFFLYLFHVLLFLFIFSQFLLASSLPLPTPRFGHWTQSKLYIYGLYTVSVFILLVQVWQTCESWNSVCHVASERFTGLDPFSLNPSCHPQACYFFLTSPSIFTKSLFSIFRLHLCPCFLNSSVLFDSIC